MPTQHWAIFTIGQVLTATGYILIVVTDVPCHLYMRWTTTEPQYHSKPVLRRGRQFATDRRFCFVVFEDNEQEEPGDTLVHTFIKEPWPVCETRWFYFHGTIAGNPSPSTSPIFNKHRAYAPPPPITETFYPDPHPEVTSVDGWTRKYGTTTWAYLLTGDAYEGRDIGSAYPLQIHSHNVPNAWRALARAFYLFDTHTLPDACIVISARFIVWVEAKVDDLNIAPSYALYASNPLSNTAIVKQDHSRVSNTPFSNKIPYANIIVNAFNTFTLNAQGISAISKLGITKFSLRNANYDAAGVDPEWSSFKQSYITTRYADAGPPGFVKLEVTYTE